MEQALIKHAPNGSLLSYITSADALVKKQTMYIECVNTSPDYTVEAISQHMKMLLSNF